MVIYSHQRDKFYAMNFITNNLSITILDDKVENNCYTLEEVFLVMKQEYTFVDKSELNKN